MLSGRVIGMSLRSDEVPWDEVFAKAGEAMFLDLLKNFAEGGRPTRWPALKTGEPSYLYQTGTLQSTIEWESGEDFAKAGALRTILPYTFVHQYGSSKRNIPQREYVLWQEDLMDEMVEMVGDAIVAFYDAEGDRIG